MPTRWTEFVKDWASKRNLTYGCAMSKPECSADYKKKYPKPLTKKQQKEQAKKDTFREGVERGEMEDEDINRARKKPKRETKEAFKMASEDILSRQTINKKAKKDKPNIRLVIEEDEPEPTPVVETKKKGRKQKYTSEEERKQAKREQTLASNKRMADYRKELLQQAREQLAMGKEDTQGKGIFKDIKKGIGRLSKATKLGVNQAIGFVEKTGKQVGKVAEDVAEDVGKYGKAVIYGRMDYPPKVRGILKKFGDEVVVNYKIKRTPVSSLLTSALSAVSLGKFGARFGRSEYDELFHLFLEMTTQTGKKISVEKNEVINMDTSPPVRDKEEVKEIKNNVPQDLTINEIMANTEKYMGKKKFFGYSARDNNCQDFIVSLLKSNNIGDAEDITFVKQNTKELFRNLPFLRKFSNTITDLGARVNVITTGAGVELISSSKEKILHNNIKRMPRFAKGSEEAKEWGRMMREKRMKGKGVCGGQIIHPPLTSVEASRPHYRTMDGGRVFCPHCETSMEGGKINIGKAFKKLGSDIKKGFNKEIAKPITSIANKTKSAVIDPAGKYITSKKGGLASDLITYAIPATTGALLGGLATAATGGNPVAGVAASALGSKLGALGGAELKKRTGTGMRKGRFAKGSQEAKDYMASIRNKRGNGLYV